MIQRLPLKLSLNWKPQSWTDIKGPKARKFCIIEMGGGPEQILHLFFPRLYGGRSLVGFPYLIFVPIKKIYNAYDAN